MTHRISHSFGTETVDPEERRRRIRTVFQAVAPRYDLMNDLMSLGIHRLWKRALVRAAAPAAGQTIVDLAGGTGDVARLMAGPDRRVLLCDPSIAMMREADRRGAMHMDRIAAEAEALPLATGSVDTITIAFGIRNVTSLDRALAEMARILKPGGRLLCLEFSRPVQPVRPLYQALSATVIPRLGSLIAGEPEAYRYLVESIRRFPHQEELKALFEAAGLRAVRYRNLTFGIACLHIGTK